MRSPGLLVLLAALPAAAATVQERTVELQLHGGGLRETERVVFLVEETGDLVALAEYPVVLDDHVELVGLEAEVLDAAGKVLERVPRRRCREITSAGGGLHSSARVLAVPFPKLEIGQRLSVRTVRDLQPYFPAHQVFLQLDLPQRRLDVRVTGAGAGFRWQALYAATAGLEVRERADGLEITGRDVPRAPALDDAADDDSGRPLLRVSWGHNQSWAEVGRWYAGLTASLPRAAGAVRGRAMEAARGAGDPLERVRRVAQFVQGAIRYEAVEVGVGGYVPTPAAETLARGWGDCKDMSELLAEMLRAVGIPAHLALVRLGRQGHVARDFPSPLQLNHCVVAVPSGALGGEVNGFIFLDPTMKDVPATWLNPEIQGQLALVEDGAGSREVVVPVRPDLEVRTLAVDGAVDGDGTFSGAAMLRLEGEAALPWLAEAATTETAAFEAELRRMLGELFAGARLGKVTWRRVEGEVPELEIEAAVALPHYAAGSIERLRVRPRMLAAFPEPRSLADRSLPAVAAPGLSRSRWTLRLPGGSCTPPPDDQVVATPAGSLRHTVSTDGEGRVVVEREARVEKAFFEPEELGPLRELAVAEARADRRSLLLDCAAREGGPDDGGGHLR